MNSDNGATMVNKRRLLHTSLGVFFVALLVAWMTQGTGVIRNDLERNIHIPEELTMPLQVKAAYNGSQMFFRYRWPSARPGIYHDMLRYDGSQWVRYGGSVPGPQPEGIYEDRRTMMVDDGSVPEFGRYGGHITIGNRMRFFTDQATGDEVKAHPYLGEERGQSEVSKYLPATRSDNDDWTSVVGAEELAITGTLGGSLSGNPSAISDLVRLTGWEPYTTFYVPNSGLALMVVAAVALVVLGVWGRRVRA